MKVLITTLIFCLVLITQGCKKDDDNTQDPIDQLPEATQRGAQTMGCLIDGEVWIPSNFGTSAPNAFYQFVDGAYTLGISGSSGSGSNLSGVRVGGIDVQSIITNNQNYSLTERSSGNYFGGYSIEGGLTLLSRTSSDNPGLLTITRFDDSIISGMFEFTVLDNDGNEIHITEGRFDLNYTN